MTSKTGENYAENSRYIKKFEYLKKLRENINDPILQDSLNKIHDAVEIIWDPNERLVKNFTDHGIEHSNRVAHNILCLLKANNPHLDEKEKYKLLASIYLHDIGMQCDLKKFTEVKDLATDYYKKATGKEDKIFKIDYTARDFSDFDYYEQKEIRKNHHLLTAAWIEVLRKDNNNKDSALHRAAKSIHEDCIEDIKDICMYHSKLGLKQGTFDNERKLILAALLRFGDELDIAKDRVSPDMYQTFRVSTENSKHWWLHQHTEINYAELKKGKVVLTYYLNPEDLENNSNIIKNYYHFKFNMKNEEIAKILKIKIESVIMKDDCKYEEVKPDLMKGLKEYEYNVEEIRVIRAKFEMQRLPKEMDTNGAERYNPFYSITFDIPENWKICPDPQKDNGNIEIKLEHNSSNIKINVINIEGHGIPQILTKKFSKTDWKKCYEKYSWAINNDIGEHYINYVLFYHDFLKDSPNFGTGLGSILPDCVKYPYFAIKYNHGIPNEWIIAWTKPEYEDKIVAIHAKFSKDYDSCDVVVGGSRGPTKEMQLPLYQILENFKIKVYRTV